jgi:hypothetical protein
MGEMSFMSSGDQQETGNVITVLTIVLGVCGGVGAALISAWAVLRARRPVKSKIELVDVSIAERSAPTDDPVIDIKVRNTGGQPAVLKRLILRVHRAVEVGRPVPEASREIRFGITLPVSAAYDIEMPHPATAAGFQESVSLSLVVAPGHADRFELRAGLKGIHGIYVYEVDLEIVYDGDDRRVNSPRVAIVLPGSGYVLTADEIKGVTERFRQDTKQIRDAIDAEMASQGLATPDWDSAPPRRRADLPDGLRSLDGDDPLGDVPSFDVTDEFWNPELAITQFLSDIERTYRELLTVTGEVTDPALTAMAERARATLAGLPAVGR